jgi:hypothetical protein
MNKTRDMGELAKFLKEVFPNKLNQEGRIDVTWLADSMEVTEQTVYNWFKTDTLPRGRVIPLIDLADNRICIDDLVPFVLK